MSALTEQLSAATIPRNQLAFVVLGLVVSAPQVNAKVDDGQLTIMGNWDFTAEEAQDLASQIVGA